MTRHPATALVIFVAAAVMSTLRADAVEPDSPRGSLRAWPPGAEVQIERTDIDADGTPDTVESVWDGGSTYGRTMTCARLAASGHVACVQKEYTRSETPYGFRLVSADPVDSNAAVAALSPRCVTADRSRAAQAAMWQLAGPNPTSGELVVPVLAWYPSTPVAPERVCMTPEQARPLAGALAWEPSGEPGVTDGWTVVVPEPGIINAGLASAKAMPKKVASGQEIEVWRVGLALAVYVRRDDRHAFFLNLEGGNDGEKWRKSLSGIEILNDREVRVTVVSPPLDSVSQVVVRLPGG